MHLEPYLTFDGNCAEAMRFYASTLDAKIEGIMTAAESPMAGKCGPGTDHMIMHACLDLGGRKLTASDSMGQPYKGMHGFSLSLHFDDVAEARRVFDRLAEGGTVTMPLDKTFWADAFGMLVDRFGTPWMVNCAPKS